CSHSIVRLFRETQISLHRFQPTKRRRTAMDRFLLFVLLFTILPFTIQEVVEQGACKCAVFSRQIAKSIIERALLYNVTCDGEGEEKCQQLCIALVSDMAGKCQKDIGNFVRQAESARDKAPQMICEKLNTHVENLHVAVYAKVCNEASWKFTGLKAAEPICCHEGKNVACEEPLPMIENSSKNKIVLKALNASSTLYLFARILKIFGAIILVRRLSFKLAPEYKATSYATRRANTTLEPLNRLNPLHAFHASLMSLQLARYGCWPMCGSLHAADAQLCHVTSNNYH
ncbi:unnamed protein product, partial [Heterotrigona itama]